MIQAVLRALKLSRLEPAFYLADDGDDPYREAVDMVLAALTEGGQASRPAGEQIQAQDIRIDPLSGSQHPLGTQDGPARSVPASPDVKGALERDVQFITAALSWYDGGPAAEDVRGAWDRVKTALASLLALPEASGWRPDGGELRSLIRSRLMDVSEAIAKADRHEVASSLADDAARKLTDAILAIAPGEAP